MGNKDEGRAKTVASRTAGAIVGEVVMSIRTVAAFNAEQQLFEDCAQCFIRTWGASSLALQAGTALD